LDRAVEEFRVAEATQEARQEELQLLEKGSRAEDIAAAQATLDEATQAYYLVKHGYRQEEIAQSQATVDAAAAAVDGLRVQQRELSVKADVDGIVSALELRPGDLVPPNGPVLSLMDTAHLWVRAYVPENRLDLQIGQQFHVTVDSFPDRQFQGKVTFIAPQAEFTPRNIQTPEERSKQVFRIKVSLLEGLDELRPGMAADVWLSE
jgi:multidrug resistance efflux pump